MTANKTTQNEDSVDEFLKKIEDPEKQKTSWQMLEIIKEISGKEPKMWGDSGNLGT